MRYRDALKLHNEDEVTVKETGAVLRVICHTSDFHRCLPSCMILCDDGNTYHHRDVR